VKLFNFVPNFLTLTNLFFGCIAVVFGVMGDLEKLALFVSLGLICDSSLLGGCFISSALSSELRTRFCEYIEEGLSGRAAAARLKLSAATGARWQRKWRETGAIAPEVQGRPPGHGKLSAHRELLEELVAQDGDITLPELAGALASATGVVAHAASIGRFLRKIGYTYKKSRWSPPSVAAPR
jgi:transposase